MIQPPASPLQSLAQSFQPPPAGGPVGPVDDSRQVRLTVVLKPRVPYDAPRDKTGRGLDAQRFRDRHRTDQAAIDRITQFATENGLTVEQIDADHHTVMLAGPMGRARSAFQPEQIGVFRQGDRQFVARSGRLSAPSHIADDVVAVVGFDQRPAVRPYVRMIGNRAAATASVSHGASYDPAEIAKVYNFPNGDGKGQTIALLEFGGGFAPAQIDAYFAHQHVARTGRVKTIVLQDGANRPDGAEGDSEVQMDIEIAGAVAPGADISVYFAPNTAKGFIDAVRQAVADKATVVSISWGNPESGWSEADRNALDQLFHSALKQATICVASGDRGALGDPDSPDPMVEFPASSQNVLACGGTSCPRGGDETGWSGSGGGFSVAFDRPPYQNGTVLFGKRGVPDLAANADLDTGYNLEVNGSPVVLGGTSAVAPLCAALIALINQKLQRSVGFINVDLYQQIPPTTDVTVGNNGAFLAATGWDPVTGLGTPDGAKILQLLQASAAPQG